MKTRKLKILNYLTALLFLSLLSCTGGKDKKLSIEFEKYKLPNGLTVVLHQDKSDPIISYAVQYHVGSSREIQGKTGFAHLFEHLLFSGSENVEKGRFDKILENAGGSNNGFTSRDVTTYFEVFPKNALEKVLWLESDRMGFFINSVTQKALSIQQNVVQNEKRQSEDNSPYGFTNYVICKNLYPQGHPYSWEVIGEMEDLSKASLDDVKKYYETFYGPNNATLVLSGDFEKEDAKKLIEKYFVEIKSHGEVKVRESMVPTLKVDVRLLYEDNFAKVPEINMVWPVPQSYQKDAYALDFLARILSVGKKAPLYKVLVKDKKLTSRVSAYNSTEELAGEFTITIRANEGKNLSEIEDAIKEAFDKFEKDGITENDIERVKAISEKGFYNGIDNVQGKAIQLAFYNTFLNDPGYINKDIENIKAVTLDDVMNVYNKYIKGKPCVITSFVPKGMVNVAANNSVKADLKEENINEASQVEINSDATDKFEKTTSSIDRTVEPQSGTEPDAKTPVVWKVKLSNGIEVAGIENKELPLVNINISIDGGIGNDKLELPGVASLTASMMQIGTKNKTPEMLEEAIELLGSSINFYAGKEEITVYSSTLSRNFDKTLSLIKEMILEPRWDSVEFKLAKTKNKNTIIQQNAQPRSVAYLQFNKLLYGDKNIYGFNTIGTPESIDKISIDDLKSFYEKNFSPSVTRINIVGNISKEEVLNALKPLEMEWTQKDVAINTYPTPINPEKSKIYFIDIPGSRQSVVYIGNIALSRNNPDYIKTEFINYRLGGSFTSIFNQILREEKGYTYGASSYFSEMKVPAPFIASTMVRSDATFETVKIFKEEMEKYRKGISPDDIQFIKNCMVRSNALNFETNNDLLGMLATITKYGFPDDYMKKEQDIIKGMTVEEHKTITEKYITPDKMFYLIVGDAATQMKPLKSIGFGDPILLKL